MDRRVGDIVGLPWTKTLYKIESLEDTWNARNISTGQLVAIDLTDTVPPRIGPFRIEKIINQSVKDEYMTLTNVSGATVGGFPDGHVLTLHYESGVAKTLHQWYLDHTNEDDAELWETYYQNSWATLDGSVPGEDDPYRRDPCMFDGHDWIETGMRVSYCRVCEAKGEFDPIKGDYKYIKD